MKELSCFQKKVVNELVKLPSNKQINLENVLLHFLPKDLHIGKSDLSSFCIWYHQDKIDYVHSELSIEILDFLNLIDELVGFNYLIRVERFKNPNEEVNIGEKKKETPYAWIRLGTNLTYIDIESYFLKFNYFPTEKMYSLPKYDYKPREEFRADRTLLYLQLSVYAALLTAIISLVSLFIRDCC